ncbi:hypothetical protein [Dyadobacter bucti]|uniref:hypothetical protein n=1 Tax=Dyadobacter bucti TaxID=2572203 RepID=UPI001109B343|nr:hypothetical protein [Dyadobacter bucti]
MATNLERFRKDLDRLITEGVALENAMSRTIDTTAFDAEVKKLFNDKKEGDAFIKALPNFNIGYEAWYSESLALLKQLLPDRVNNFVALYEKPKARKSVSYGNYVIQDYLQKLRVSNYGETVVDSSAALPQFRQQVAIIRAAEKRFESSLFEIRQLVQADMFDSEIDTARELLKHKFLRAAGAIAGVVLEKHLRQVCEDRSLSITKKNPGISDLNEILKSNGTIDVAQWRHISMLGDIRNLCDHSKSQEPTHEQVTDLINGTDKILKTVA